MAKRGGSGKSSFQDHFVLPDPSKDSCTAFERRLLEAKSHLLALRPADAEAVTNFMIVMQLRTFIKQGTLLPDEKYRKAYCLALDGMEQELDAPGQLGPLSLAKMKEVDYQLQVTLQSLCFSEVPPKIAAANKQISLEARVRKLEAGGGGKPPDKPPPDKTTSAASGPPRGGGRGKGRGPWERPGKGQKWTRGWTRAHCTSRKMFHKWEGGLQAVDVPQWQPGCAKGARSKAS